MAVDDGPLGQPIVVRFDGGDAAKHELELISFAESLNGMARIIAASGHFALTQEMSLRRDRQAVRVVIRTPERHCFYYDAIVQLLTEHPTIKEYTVASAAALTTSLITFIVTRRLNRRDEMKEIRGALDTAIRELAARDQPTIDRLLSTIETMADKLQPAVKNAIAPIGKSATKMTVAMASVSKGVEIDEADKAVIMAPPGMTVDEERSYSVLISELDMETGACHVDIETEPERGRVLAKITDPAVSLAENPYVMAMAAKSFLRVRAKATEVEGRIDRLFISNWEDRPRGEDDFALVAPDPDKP